MQSPLDHETDASFGTRLSPDDVHLRILATSDLHMQIWPYDYFHDRPQARGLALAADQIEDLRKTAANTLLFDNGDFLQGNPMADLAAEGMFDPSHPMITAFNALGVDAVTLGNHEFNYGLRFLEKIMEQARFPIVSANLLTTKAASQSADTYLACPWVILDRVLEDASGAAHPLGIGVVGFAPPQTTAWDHAQLSGRIFARDIVAAARHHVPLMKAAGADLVIALAHSGIDSLAGQAMQENATVQLAAVEDVDAVVAGHTHLVFPGPDHSPSAYVDRVAGKLSAKPAVMPGSKASHVGVIDLQLSRRDNTWSVIQSRSAATKVARATPTSRLGQAVLTATRDAHLKTLTHIRQPVGATEVPLHSYFAAVQPTDPVKLIAAAQMWYAQQVLAGSESADLPLLSAAAAFKCGGRGGPENYTNISSGVIQQRHLSDIYPFPNLFTVLRVTGADIRNWLEYVAGQYRQIVPGRLDQPLIDPVFPGHDADTILGVTYEIDLTSQARFFPNGNTLDWSANRIKKLMYRGQPVKDDSVFLVATNSYRASGDGSFPGARAGKVAFQNIRQNKDILANYVRNIGPIASLPKDNWAFTPIKDTSAMFATGPGAEGKIGSLKADRIGETEDGFVQYRIYF